MKRDLPIIQVGALANTISSLAGTAIGAIAKMNGQPENITLVTAVTASIVTMLGVDQFLRRHAHTTVF